MDVETTADRFVGIDVSKARVDVHVRPDGTAFYSGTDTEGLAELVRRLTPLRPTLVVLEASGGYEGVIAATLAELGLPVAVVSASGCAFAAASSASCFFKIATQSSTHRKYPHQSLMRTLPTVQTK
jgi:hypothetical protein